MSKVECVEVESVETVEADAGYDKEAARRSGIVLGVDAKFPHSRAEGCGVKAPNLSGLTIERVMHPYHLFNLSEINVRHWHMRFTQKSVGRGFQPLFDRRESTFQGGADFPDRDMPHNASFEPCEPRLL